MPRKIGKYPAPKLYRMSGPRGGWRKGKVRIEGDNLFVVYYTEKGVKKCEPLLSVSLPILERLRIDTRKMHDYREAQECITVLKQRIVQIEVEKIVLEESIGRLEKYHPELPRGREIPVLDESDDEQDEENPKEFACNA